MSDDTDDSSPGPGPGRLINFPAGNDVLNRPPELPDPGRLFPQPATAPPETPEETTLEIPAVREPMHPEIVLGSEGISGNTVPENVGEDVEGEGEYEYEHRPSVVDRLGDWLEYRIALGYARMESESPYREAEIEAKVAALKAASDRDIGLLEAQNKLRAAQLQAQAARAAARGKGDAAALKSAGSGGGKPGGAGGKNGGAGGGRSGGPGKSGGSGSVGAGRGVDKGGTGKQQPKPGADDKRGRQAQRRAEQQAAAAKANQGKQRQQEQRRQDRQQAKADKQARKHGAGPGSGSAGKGSGSGRGGGKGSGNGSGTLSPRQDRAAGRQQAKNERRAARQERRRQARDERRGQRQQAGQDDRARDRDQKRPWRQEDQDRKRAERDARRDQKRAKKTADAAGEKRPRSDGKQQPDPASDQNGQGRRNGRDRARGGRNGRPMAGEPGSAGTGAHRPSGGPGGGPGSPGSRGPLGHDDEGPTVEWPGRQGRPGPPPHRGDGDVPAAVTTGRRGLPPAPETHTARPGTSRPPVPGTPPPPPGPGGGPGAPEQPQPPLRIPHQDKESHVNAEVKKAAQGRGLAAKHRTDITLDEYLMEIVNVAIAAAADKEQAEKLAEAVGKIAHALRDMATDLVGDHNIATEVTNLITDLADAAARMVMQAQRCATECEVASEAATLASVAVGRTYSEDIRAMDDAGLSHASAAAHHD
ncbi:ATP/GTP-binding protein [Streptomyces sp. MS2.AVA.5]|uniref:ATP/GTP-binding protein n=1 Tax=Streptomyces achmelvichensis TaxID=3134111 RepID=A0ACC6PL27_9ACTN